MSANLIEKANRIVNSAEDAYIGVIDEKGYPSVSTVSSIQTDGIFKVYFATNPDGNKGKRIIADNRASVCYRKDGNNVTLVGTAKVLTDENIRHELWQDWFINHFPEGKDDPDYCILEFTTQRISLWIDNEGAEYEISNILKVQSRCGLLCDSCSFREPCQCKKCVETNGKPFHGECSIALCCQSKGFTHCGECDNVPCEPLHQYSFLDTEHGDNPPGARVSMLKYWKKYS